MAAYMGERKQNNKENMLVIDQSGRGLKRLERPAVNESTAQCTTLILDKNGLSKVEHLEVYPHLQQLSVANNRIIRMNGIAKLRTLRVLNLPNNSIQSIEGLRELLELEWLNLSGNSLKNVEHLSTNLRLRHLDLSDNSISVISDISMLSQLTTLLLHGNILTTLRSFPSYVPTSLEILSLAENEISDLAEVSYLSCLSNLKQLSVMNNPCVMFAASSMASHGGFDYRPYVVNWSLALEILDGSAITQKESLKAEWLYSQGKGRKFHPGQHVQLAEYLSHTCPLTTASELQSKEDQRLLNVLKQQKKHLHELHSPVQSPSAPCRTPTVPLSSPTTPQPVISPSSPDRPNSTRPTSSHKPGRKTSGHTKNRHRSPVTSTVGRIESPTVQSPQDDTSSAWNYGGTEEPSLHKNFYPGGKVSKSTIDLTVRDIDDDVLDSNSIHLPYNTNHAMDGLRLPRVSPTPGTRARSRSYDGSTNHMDSDFKLPSVDSQGDESDSQSSLSQYDLYESRPLKPPQEVKGYLEQIVVNNKEPLPLDEKVTNSDAVMPGREVLKSPTHALPLKGRDMNRRRGRSTECPTELKHIKDVAKAKKRLKRATTPDPGGSKVRGHGVISPRPRSSPTPSDVSGSNYQKGRDEAAAKIQAVWRGHQAREKDETIVNIHEVIKTQRTDEHIQYLTKELERTRQAYEKEKSLRVLQMEAMKLLWNQISRLQASFSDISSYFSLSQLTSGSLVLPFDSDNDPSPMIFKGNQPGTESQTTSSDKSKQETVTGVTTPTNVTAVCRSSTSIGISWGPSSVSDSTGPVAGSLVDGYKLHIDLKGNRWDMEVPGSTQTSLGGLVPGTYKLCVSAYKGNVTSSQSPWVEVTLPPSSHQGNSSHRTEVTTPAEGAQVISDTAISGHGERASTPKQPVQDTSSDGCQRVAALGQPAAAASSTTNKVATEMSLEIIEGLLSNVLSDESSMRKDKSVSSNCHPPEEPKNKPDTPNQRESSPSQTKDFPDESDASLLDTVRFDSDNEDCLGRLHAKEVHDIDKETSRKSGQDSGPIEGKLGSGRQSRLEGQKKSGQGKIAATFALNDSFTVGHGERTEKGSGKGSKQVKETLIADQIRENPDGTNVDTSKPVDEGTFDLLLPLENLLRGEARHHGDTKDEDIGNPKACIHYGPRELRDESSSSSNTDSSPQRRKVPSLQVDVHRDSKKTAVPPHHPQGHQPSFQYNRKHTSGGSKAKPKSDSSTSSCKGKISRYHQAGKGGIRTFGIRRTGSEPNLSTMEDPPSHPGHLLSPSGAQNGGSPQRTKVRRSSAGSEAAIGKPNVKKKDKVEETASQKPGDKLKKEAIGQNISGNFKVKRAQGSIVPALISPGFQAAKGPSRLLPMKHLKEKTASSGQSSKPSGKIGYQGRKNIVSTSSSGKTSQIKVRGSNNNSNNSNECDSHSSSWETASDSDEEL